MFISFHNQYLEKRDKIASHNGNMINLTTQNNCIKLYKNCKNNCKNVYKIYNGGGIKQSDVVAGSMHMFSSTRPVYVFGLVHLNRSLLR